MIEDFNLNLLKIDKKSYKNISINHIGYITTENIIDYKSINSVNSLYFIAGKVDRHIQVEKKNKHLFFDSTHENKEVLKNKQNFGI